MYIKRATVLVFALSGACMGCGQEHELATAASPVASAVLEAAERDAERFIQAIPAGLEPRYGFSERSELERATPGRPIAMLTLSEDASGIRELDVWRVPLLVDGTHRALLTVARRDQDWKAVEIGAASLATELGPRLSGTDEPIGLLRVYQLRSDFFMVGEDIYPLRSAQLFLGLDPERALSLSRIIELTGGAR